VEEGPVMASKPTADLKKKKKKQTPLNPKKGGELGLPECYLVHPVSLNSKLATVAMGETGPDDNAMVRGERESWRGDQSSHSLGIVLLLGDLLVLGGDLAPQLAKIHSLGGLARALNGLGAPTLFLLRDVVLFEGGM